MNSAPSVVRPFRLATAADVPALAALYGNTARELGPLVYGAEQVRAWQTFADDTPAFNDYVLKARTWIAEDESGPAGFCGIAAGGEVHSLYVRADAVRCGLGTALLAHAIDDASRRGIDRLDAWATPFSLPLFRRAGFVLLRTVREPYQGVMFDRFRVARP